MDLILGNFRDTNTCTRSTPPRQLESIPTGTALPPVPTSLVEKVEPGAIKMGDLIPTRLGLDDTARSKLRCSVTNISEWLQVFTVYVSVIAKKQPHRVPDLMGYQILILKASNEYCNDISGNKLLLSPTVSDQIWTPSYGTRLSLVKQELVNAVIASVSFILPKFVS